MHEDKELLERKLDIINNKIINKEDNIRGSLYIFGVGVLGALNGVIMSSHSSYISGMIVASGGIIFKIINRNSLDRLIRQRYDIEYVLKYDDLNYNSYNKGGKHFKK